MVVNILCSHAFSIIRGILSGDFFVSNQTGGRKKAWKIRSQDCRTSFPETFISRTVFTGLFITRTVFTGLFISRTVFTGLFISRTVFTGFF